MDTGERGVPRPHTGRPQLGRGSHHRTDSNKMQALIGARSWVELRRVVCRRHDGPG